MRLGAVGLCQY